MSEHEELEQAVIDRIEDGQNAVLIISGYDREIVVPANQLPEGAEGGSWLRVRFDGDAFVEVHLDTEKTESMKASVHEKLEQLRNRGRKRRD